jgi:hypothetical protein
VAIDPETKLVPAYGVGKLTRDSAVAFMTDLSARLSNRGAFAVLINVLMPPSLSQTSRADKQKSHLRDGGLWRLKILAAGYFYCPA